MKHKLSQRQLDAAIEELKSLEFDTTVVCKYGQVDIKQTFDLSEMVAIAEPLKKPVIRNVEDLKALEGEWEFSDKSVPTIWMKKVRSYWISLSDISKQTRIRQISLPSNSFLLSECIEHEIEEIEVGDLIYYGYNVGGKDFEGYIIVHSIDVAGYKSEPNEAGGYNYLDFDHCKLIRKAKDITIEDRVKYLGEEPEIEEIEVGDLAKHDGGFVGLVQDIWDSGVINVEIGTKGDEYCYSLKDCKLIRKAKDITESDRIKYLGETPKSLYSEEHHTAEELRDMAMSNNNEPVSKKSVCEIMDLQQVTDLGSGRLFSEFEIKQISQIIDDKLKERAE
jgi:hypothetical protein